MLLGIDTYRSLVKVFLMPTIEKIFNDHSRVIGSFGVCVDEDTGEVVLMLSNIPLCMNGYYVTYSISDSEYYIIYNEVIDALVKMGFNRENLSFGHDTISFRNFEFHKKLLNKNEEHLWEI